ncbi:MAG: YjbQ family protein [Gemmatimonadetes bacterium]|nr:YjbQ family protein [Gemmatimonadota bacterium]
MKVFTESIKVHTARAPQFVDLTETIADIVERAGVDAGACIVYSKHTTAGVVINEDEPLLLKDMEHFLDRVAAREAYYGHNDFSIRTVHMHDDECPNGHAHCQHLFVGASEHVPIVGGRLALGEWQRVFLVELDMARPREVLVQVMGV